MTGHQHEDPEEEEEAGQDEESLSEEEDPGEDGEAGHYEESLAEEEQALEILQEIKQQHDLAKAVKADDAEVTVIMWDQAVFRRDPRDDAGV